MYLQYLKSQQCHKRRISRAYQFHLPSSDFVTSLTCLVKAAAFSEISVASATSKSDFPSTTHFVQEQWDAAGNVFHLRASVVSHRNVAMSLPPLVHFRLIELEASL